MTNLLYVEQALKLYAITHQLKTVYHDRFYLTTKYALSPACGIILLFTITYMSISDHLYFFMKGVPAIMNNPIIYLMSLLVVNAQFYLTMLAQ